MNNEKLEYFGTLITYNSIIKIGVLVEEKKLLWLIPLSRMRPFIAFKEGNEIKTLLGSGMTAEQAAHWTIVTHNQIELTTGKKGQKEELDNGLPFFIYE